MLNPQVEITKKGFLELFYHFNKAPKSMKDAYYEAVEHCDKIKLHCRFQSYDGFRKNVLEREIKKGKML